MGERFGHQGMEKETANMSSFFLLYIFYIMKTQPNILEGCYIIRQVFFALWFLYREICMLLFGQPQALGNNNSNNNKKYKKYK